MFATANEVHKNVDLEIFSWVIRPTDWYFDNLRHST